MKVRWSEEEEGQERGKLLAGERYGDQFGNLEDSQSTTVKTVYPLM